MEFLKGQKIHFLASANGALIKVSGNLEGHPQIPTSGYFNVREQQAFDGLFEFTTIADATLSVEVDESIVVYSSTGDVFCKYNGIVGTRPPRKPNA